MLGALETGGTKTACAIFDASGTLARRGVIATGDPQDTVMRVVEFFSSVSLDALGVGAFGPIGVHRERPEYGILDKTPKPGWSGFDLRGALRRDLRCEVVVTTDVGAAALGEARAGAGRGCNPLIYVTVGTGIGAGVVLDGCVHHGHAFLEFGHVPVARRSGDSRPSTCPFHAGCLEGLVSGPALQALVPNGERFGEQQQPLALDLAADYLAQGITILTLAHSPRRILIGGGVMKTPGLLPAIREKTLALLGGYLTHLQTSEQMEDFLLPPGLGEDAALVGAKELARDWLDH